MCILVDKSLKESVGAPDQMTVNPTQQVGEVIPTPLSGIKKYSRHSGRIKRKKWCMGGSYAGVDFNLTLCPHQSRLQHIYHGQLCARVDFIPQ